MTIAFETNGKGYLGWLIDFPGSYIRGKTLEDARAKIDNELIEYFNWLEIVKPNNITIENELIFNSKLMIEDADSDIIFENEKIQYNSLKEFENDLDSILISAKKTDQIYRKSNPKDIIDYTMVRKTFYGSVYKSINEQFNHIVNVQNYYLGQILEEININNDIVNTRKLMINVIKEKYLKEGNLLYKNENEEWTIKKIIRRTIWHDRIHAKAIARIAKILSK